MGITDWNELKKARDDPVFRKKILIRTNKVQKEYDKQKREITDYESYIKNTYLNNAVYSLVPNRFPYKLKKGINHFILWASKELDNITIEKILKEHCLDSNNSIWFINSVEDRSVPSVWHLHLFTK